MKNLSFNLPSYFVAYKMHKNRIVIPFKKCRCHRKKNILDSFCVFTRILFHCIIMEFVSDLFVSLFFSPAFLCARRWQLLRYAYCISHMCQCDWIISRHFVWVVSLPPWAKTKPCKCILYKSTI